MGNISYARTNKLSHKRGELSFECRTLRLEKRGKKKWVIIQFDGTHFTRRILRSDAKRSRNKRCLKFRIQAIAAPIAFTGFFTSVHFGDARACTQPNRTCCFHKSAFEWCYDRTRSIWCCLCVIGVSPSQHVPCVLDDRMLEPRARTQEWTVSHPSKLDCTQRSVHASIGTRWHAPKTVEARNPRNVSNLVCRHPFELDWHFQSICRKLKRNGNRLVRRNRRVVVANQSNSNH